MSKSLSIINKEQKGIPAVSEKELSEYLDLYGYSDLSTKEKGQFLKVSQMSGLNPFKKEIYVVAYGGGSNRTFSIITGFQVYLKRAEETGLLDSWDTPIIEPCKTASVDRNTGEITFIDDIKATITIHRKDFSRPFTHVVKYSEQVVKTKQGVVTKFWLKAEQQLKKVCMGQGFRLCFSGVLGSLPYTDAELNSKIVDAESEDVTPKIETKAIPEPETVSNEFVEKLISELENFETLISGIKEKHGKLNFTAEQRKKINNAGKYGDGALQEITEMINKGVYELKDFNFSLTEEQLQTVTDALLDLEAEQLAKEDI